ncbi:hypothetical protein [Curtobacterium sp. MCBD17_040]|uniref:hypothetical protein n=1 Tax=Curtobacterium sp. MCBD17_040 TaxID=2175674 RepID=UPI0011B5B88E|nr:hypothetical protein [Curtobacterium sp. MCBD17_040]WIB65702.1 hypothetical protein DEI94_16405 [Curtobacterium sp. MCBD17_040]
MPERTSTTAATDVAAVVAPKRSKPGLRVLADPFVVATPTGARTRTRLHLSAAEAAALTRIGEYLGGQYRQTLANRIRLGRLDQDGRKLWRAEEKRRLTAVSSSRWAGALTRAVNDQYQLGMRGLVAEVRMLHQATEHIAARMAVPVGENVPGTVRRSKPIRGYASENERFMKSRRRGALLTRLNHARADLSAGTPTVVVGSGRLWRNREHLDEAGLTREAWEEQWAAARMFLTADGESGTIGGNHTIRVLPDGRVHVKVPAALVAELGTRQLLLTAPLTFTTHCGAEWADRVDQRKAVRYDISVEANGRWYLHPSWAYPEAPTVPLDALRQQRTLGVDVNGGHFDAAVIDVSGNVIGRPVRLEAPLEGLPASARDAHLRHTVTRLITLAQQHGCASISIEDLGFDDARATGRETMGRGKAGKRFRRTVAGIPTAKFRQRLVGMTATAGLSVIAVDRAYTSAWGKQHWLQPLIETFGGSIDGHRAAAVVIGRRALARKARRTPAGPRPRQRTRPGQPTGRPQGQPRTPRAAREGSRTTPPTPQDGFGRVAHSNVARRQHRSDGTVHRKRVVDSLTRTQ